MQHFRLVIPRFLFLAQSFFLLLQSPVTKYLPPHLIMDISNSIKPKPGVISLNTLISSGLPHLCIWEIFHPFVQNIDHS